MMRLAIALTLLFCAATSVLGVSRQVVAWYATRNWLFGVAAIFSLCMTAWLGYLAIWMLNRW